MNFEIVFDNTGDTIPFVSMNTPVLEYYVDQLNKHNINGFVMRDYRWDRIHLLTSRLEKIHSSVKDVDEWLYELIGQRIGPYEFEDYFDQRVLNKIHADWVKSHTMPYDIDEQRQRSNYQGLAEQLHNMYPDDIRHPPFGDVLKKLNLEQSYAQVNELCHKIEESFVFFEHGTKNVNWIEFDNPFGPSVCDNDIANFEITFAHLGRCLYNKYQHFDMELEYNDENTFDQLLNFVTVGLAQPQTIPFSKEYIAWCKKHDKIPSGERLNVGKIPDLADKIKDYRLIMYRNIKQRNQFFINL